MARVTFLGTGRASVGAVNTAGIGLLWLDGNWIPQPGAGVLSGFESRDPGNTGFTNIIRPGTIMAKHPTTGRYAPWAISTTTAAITGASTTINIGVAGAVELVRRIGPTGVFTLTGPALAHSVALENAGTNVVRQTVVTYSGVDTSNGNVTVTALGARNQIDRIQFNASATGGNLQLTVQLANGNFVTTANIAWNATDATYLASINSALDTATGVSGAIVASAVPGIDTDNAIQLTYSGTGYANRPFVPATVAVFPTGTANAQTTVFQNAVGFIAGSIVSKANFTTPNTLVGEPNGVIIPIDNSGVAIGDVDWRLVPQGGNVRTAALLPALNDTGLRNWVRGQLNLNGNGLYVFN